MADGWAEEALETDVPALADKSDVDDLALEAAALYEAGCMPDEWAAEASVCDAELVGTHAPSAAGRADYLITSSRLAYGAKEAADWVGSLRQHLESDADSLRHHIECTEVVADAIFLNWAQCRRSGFEQMLQTQLWLASAANHGESETVAFYICVLYCLYLLYSCLE